MKNAQASRIILPERKVDEEIRKQGRDGMCETFTPGAAKISVKGCNAYIITSQC